MTGDIVTSDIDNLLLPPTYFKDFLLAEGRPLSSIDHFNYRDACESCDLYPICSAQAIASIYFGLWLMFRPSTFSTLDVQRSSPRPPTESLKHASRSLAAQYSSSSYSKSKLRNRADSSPSLISQIAISYVLQYPKLSAVTVRAVRL